MDSRLFASIFAGVTLISLLTLPWAISLVTMAIAGFFFPLSALILGIFADILYYPGHGLPVGTLCGIGLTAGMLLVRHFVKTRIM